MHSGSRAVGHRREPQAVMRDVTGEPFGARRQLSDGRVAVLDGESCELRFFGPDGVFLNRAGGMGEGPGEFRRRCFWAPSSVLDSLFVFDGPRLSAFDEQGRFGHRMLISWNGARVSRVRGVARRRVLAGYAFFSTPGPFLQRSQQAKSVKSTLHSDKPTLHRSIETAQDSDIHRPRGTQQCSTTPAVTSPSGSSSFTPS